MSIDTTTARSEIYDIAQENGFGLEVAEGVERRILGRSATRIEYVTRFIIRRTPESIARLKVAGVPQSRVDEEFTVVFNENDGFSTAWDHRYGYLSREKPWSGRNQSSHTLNKGRLIERLQSCNVDRLVFLHEQRHAAQVAAKQAIHEQAILAHQAAVRAVIAAQEDATSALRQHVSQAHGIDLPEAVAIDIVCSLNGNKSFTGYQSALASVARAYAARDAAAADYLRVTES